MCDGALRVQSSMSVGVGATMGIVLIECRNPARSSYQSPFARVCEAIDLNVGAARADGCFRLHSKCPHRGGATLLKSYAIQPLPQYGDFWNDSDSVCVLLPTC